MLTEYLLTMCPSTELTIRLRYFGYLSNENGSTWKAEKNTSCRTILGFNTQSKYTVRDFYELFHIFDNGILEIQQWPF